ncbi:MAG: ABC transporter permease [Chloroflexi bacterium]|nr:MAG: ABC transporter permease [Chloroflexota bacterium]
MGKYLVRRMIWMFFVLFLVSLITFILMHQVPGGPFDRERSLPQVVIENREARYHLDDPLWKQYVDYVHNISIPRITTEKQDVTTLNDYLINVDLSFLGEHTAFRWMNFGPSLTQRSRTVNDIFRENLPVSAQLGLAAVVVACVIGIPLGTLAALNRNSAVDYLGMGVAILGVSVPIVVMGPLLRYIFGVQLRVLPPTGWGSFEQLIMPAFALGFASSALLARLTRASLLQVLDEDYIRTAHSKGLRKITVITRHAMKNAMIPVVTVLGPLLAALMTGTFVTEQVFAINGMGKFFIVSVTNRDYPVVMGTILLYAASLVVANFFVDLTYAWLDPRIRFD